MVVRVRQARRCSRSACTEQAVATLTYVYVESTAVVGPLATQAEPHSYDLCAGHARRLTVPRGWDVVRHEGELPSAQSPDELDALAEAVREAGRAVRAAAPAGPVAGAGRHLRVLPGSGD